MSAGTDSSVPVRASAFELVDDDGNVRAAPRLSLQIQPDGTPDVVFAHDGRLRARIAMSSDGDVTFECFDSSGQPQAPSTTTGGKLGD